MPHRKTVLYIDDNVADRVLLRRALQGQPLIVLCVDSGVEGIEAAQHHHPDVILLDLQMPGLDGREVITVLREKPQTADIPIVVVTGNDDPRLGPELLEMGAAAVLVKTGDIRRLTELVLDACDLSG